MHTQKSMQKEENGVNISRFSDKATGMRCPVIFLTRPEVRRESCSDFRPLPSCAAPMLIHILGKGGGGTRRGPVPELLVLL